jgi:hypothetical protein
MIRQASGNVFLKDIGVEPRLLVDNIINVMLYDALLAAWKVNPEFESHSLRHSVRDYHLSSRIVFL